MWALDTTKHFKIWFSKDKNCFLGIENQLRFVKFRTNNPKATIHFIYSSKALSDKAREELHTFCKTYNIIPVDFDTEIERKLTHETDKATYAIANQELIRSLKNEGGNLAAASDAVRILIPVQEEYGAYSDFEIDINISPLPPTIDVSVPIIFTATPVNYCNDFIGATRDPENLQKLHSKAKEQLYGFQKQLLKRYENPREALSDVFALSSAQLKNYLYKNMLNIFFDKNSFPTIFDLRKYIAQLDTLQFIKGMENEPSGKMGGINSLESIQEWKEKFYSEFFAGLDGVSEIFCAVKPVERTDEYFDYIKYGLYKLSVEYFSGPVVLEDIAKTTVPDSGSIRVCDEQIPYARYYDAYRNLEPYVWNKLINNVKGSFNIGDLCDLSWTELGKKKVDERENNIDSATRLLQNVVRTWLIRKSEIKKQVHLNCQLVQAVMKGDHIAVRNLIEKHADVKAIHFGKTPLWHAADRGYLEIVKTLIDAKADVDQPLIENNSNTLLHHVAWCGNIEMVRMLIHFGANVNARNGNDETPLHLAIASNSKKSSLQTLIAQVLIENKAEVNIADKSGNTPLHFVCKQNGIGWWRNPDTEQFEQAQLLIQHGANVNAVTVHGETPIQIANSRTNYKLAELLREHATSRVIRDDQSEPAKKRHKIE